MKRTPVSDIGCGCLARTVFVVFGYVGNELAEIAAISLACRSDQAIQAANTSLTSCAESPSDVSTSPADVAVE